MIKIVALVRRELSVYFISPVAYIVLTGYLVACGWFFTAGVISAVEQKISLVFAGTFEVISYLAIMITPVVTMRLIAEEKNSGTIESLMTAPVSDVQVVISKFIGALTFFTFLLLPTLAYVAIVRHYAAVDWGATLTGYAGLMLFLAFLVSIGLFISSIAGSQMVAAVVTLILMVGLLMVSIYQSTVDPGSPLWIALTYLDVAQRNAGFARGILDTRDLIFFGFGTAFFLFGSTLVLESRRWR